MYISLVWFFSLPETFYPAVLVCIAVTKHAITPEFLIRCVPNHILLYSILETFTLRSRWKCSVLFMRSKLQSPEGATEKKNKIKSWPKFRNSCPHVSTHGHALPVRGNEIINLMPQIIKVIKCVFFPKKELLGSEKVSEKKHFTYLTNAVASQFLK